jgi:circadian clock protein KaiA
LQLSVCIFATCQSVTQPLLNLLSSDQYGVTQLSSPSKVSDYVERHIEQIDCLVLYNYQSLPHLLNQLYERGTLLPVVIIEPEELSSTSGEKPTVVIIEPEELSSTSGEKPSPSISCPQTATHLYHAAEVRLRLVQLNQIAASIEQALTQFLNLAPSCALAELFVTVQSTQENFLVLKQHRLSKKFKERLGYLGRVLPKKSSKISPQSAAAQTRRTTRNP